MTVPPLPDSPRSRFPSAWGDCVRQCRARVSLLAVALAGLAAGACLPSSDSGGKTPAGTGGSKGGTGGSTMIGATGGNSGGTGSGGNGVVGTGGASSQGSGGAGASVIGTGGSGSGGATAAPDAGTPDTPGTGGQITPGVGGAGSGGAGGTGAGAGGRGGTSGGGGSSGVAGAGGGTDDGRAAAMVLDGFALLKPCVSSYRPTPNPNGSCCCEELAANENQRITKQLGGDPNVTYNVKIRVAGVAERYWYTGGTLDPTGKVFYTGGLPTIHSTEAPNNNLRPGQGACKIHPPETDGQFALPFAVPPEIKPTDGCYNGFNIFAMVISSPKQSYYLNQTTEFDGADRQPHRVYKTDYTVTVPMAGQAKLDFYTIDGDHHQVTNDGTMTVPNVKTAQPYNGNFLELTVVEVTRAN